MKQNLITRSSTTNIFNFLGNIHAIGTISHSGSGLSSSSNVISNLFISHFSQISCIFSWASGNLFHLAWQGNYSLWQSNPGRILPISHSSWDPNFGLYGSDVYSSGFSEVTSTPSYSGIYQWMYTVGVRSESDIYILSFALEVLALLFMATGYLHSKLEESVYSGYNTSHLILEIAYSSPGYRLNYHISSLLGLSSVLWSLHLSSVSVPYSRGSTHFLTSIPMSPLLTGDWIYYSLRQDGPSHLHASQLSSGNSLITFIGSLNPNSSSLYLTDMVHHHLSLGVLLLWSSHLYSSLYKAIGHRLRDLAMSQGSGTSPLSSPFLLRSLDLELSISLAVVSQASAYTAQHMYSLSPYVYLSMDYVTLLALYSHHIWISSFCLVGSMVHGMLFLIRDYTMSATHSGDIIYRLLAHKACVISHLSWVSLWLGFHTLLVYAHNDAVSALGEPEKQLSLEPIFCQLVQEFSGKNLYGTTLISQVGTAYSPGLESSLLPVGPADLLVHHAISLGLHTTVLILVKGALDSRGSKLMPDKLLLGFSYPCDGPGRGGTCDVSSWDSMYLAFFWMLNTVAWSLFYFQWKHLTIWQNNVASFNESGVYLMAWFRDYLWFNSSPLIRGYSTSGPNDNGVWAWVFLAAHLCWATGFMFLISWRGYWQELIESIIWSHTLTPIVSDIWNATSYTPVALSIVQARFIGLVHFSVGFIVTYSAFVIASAS